MTRTTACSLFNLLLFPLLVLAVVPVARTEPDRQVMDRLVICFDEAGFLREISSWDDNRYWPVLLWESGLAPKFIEAFRPKQVLLAEYSGELGVSREACLRAVAQAWGVERLGKSLDSQLFLDTLGARSSSPLGAVLLSESSPELLGGVALAAGRFHLPLFFETTEKHAARVPFGKAEEYRSAIAAMLARCGVAFSDRTGDLDFLVVANDMPFGYLRSDQADHPGGYTIDDLLARGDDGRRWAATGRLAGGPARSIYMVMCALFLQPGTGLFFSRYGTEGQGAFARFDPQGALETFGELFPTEAVRHPGATLERWRELQWPQGNRAGFLYVNSSGGATNWSTSNGNASFFDVPETVPAVVHFTHSGSAANPFECDTIAGRWLENGAFIYYGSYAEPYLSAFVPPVELARRVASGMPLGAAMRHAYSENARAQRSMKRGETESPVKFNVTAPWKLAYFGDPSYRLTGIRVERLEPKKPGRGLYSTSSRLRSARRATADQKAAHRLAGIGIALVNGKSSGPVNDAAWLKIAKTDPDPEPAGKLQREMTRVWVASLRRAGIEELHSERSFRKLLRFPRGLQRITSQGGSSVESGRIFSEFAKEYMAGLSLHLDGDGERKKRLAALLLQAACCFEHSPRSAGPLFGWIKETCRTCGVETDALREEVLKNRWIAPAAREAVKKNLPQK